MYFVLCHQLLLEHSNWSFHGSDGSLEELEKVYQTAINGSEEERSAAASILCGASFLRGWNVQVIYNSIAGMLK